MVGISSIGVGSGIDLEGLIGQLLAAEGSPESSRLDRREAEVQAEISAFGALKSALSDFESIAETLSKPETFDLRTAISADSAIFTVSAEDDASEGLFGIEVVRLAEADKRRSGSFASSSTVVGTGKLTIAAGSNSFDITIDSSNNTVEGIRDAIQSSSDNTFVSASLVTISGGTQLVLTSLNTGAANTISVTTDDDDLNDTDNSGLSQLATTNLTQLQTPVDAEIKIDTQSVTSASNVFVDAIDKVTITAVKVSSVGVETDLNIKKDTGSINTHINDFVTKYNDLNEAVDALIGYDPETKVAGTLLGDPMVRGIQAKLRQIMGEDVSSMSPSATISRLADIGTETQLNGNLITSGTTLTDTLSKNLDEVKELFTSSSGIGVKIAAFVEPVLQLNGILDQKNDTLEGKITEINGLRDKLSYHLDKLEERLRSQFSALDMLVSKLKSQGDFLMGQLNSLPGFKKQDS